MPRSTQAAEDKSELEAYIEAHHAMIRMIKEGKSFSGNERNCVFLNTSHPRFANVSSAVGLDFKDDGRGMAVLDWDQDGDLDMWLRNRSGPRLRLLLNRTDSLLPKNQWVYFRLQGTSCNRDAIGARVEVHLKDPRQGRMVQTLHAGDGYLSQSSKWMHFGLGTDAEIDHVTVRWPAGETETFGDIEPQSRYLLIQDSGEPVERPVSERQLSLVESDQPKPQYSETASSSLPDPFPLPVLRYTKFDDPAPREIKTNSRPLLVNFWASWCLPCLGELQDFTERQQEIRAAGLDVLAITVDGISVDHDTTPANAQQLINRLEFPFDTGVATSELIDKVALITEIHFYRRSSFDLPFSMLLDAEGRLLSIYRGVVEIDALLEDLDQLSSASPLKMMNLSVPMPGRWYDEISTDLREIAGSFRGRYNEDFVRYVKGATKQIAKIRELTLPEHEQKRLQKLHADLYVSLAKTAWETGDADQVIEQYRNALTIRPNYARVHYNLAVALAGRRQVELAAEHYRQAIKSDPKIAEAHNNLGMILVATGSVDEGVTHFRQAISLDSEFGRAYFNLGRALRLQGNFSEAGDQFRAALQVNPGYYQAHFWLGMIQQGQGDDQAAAESFDRVLSIEPGHEMAHRMLATLRYRQGKYAVSVNHFRQLAKVVPDDVEVLNALAWLLATQPLLDPSDRQEAVQLAQHAIELAEQLDPSLLDTLAAAYASTQRFKDAIATARRALTLAETRGDAQFAERIGDRVKLYERGQSYRETPAGGSDK